MSTTRTLIRFIEAHRSQVLIGAAILVAGAFFVLLAVLRLEEGFRPWDSHVLWAAALRMVRVPGGYYLAGIDHKGPVWLATHHLAMVAGGVPGFWYAIAVGITVIAIATAAALAWIVVRSTRRRTAAVAVFILTAVFLTFGERNFAILFARNVTMVLAAVSFALLIGLRWSEPTRAFWVRVATSGVALGLAIQTVPTAVLSAAAIAVYVFANGYRKNSSKEATRIVAVWLGSLGAGLASMFAYFGVTGRLGEFWSYWWTYNRTYASAYESSPVEIAVDGFRWLWSYYATHQVMVAVVIAFSVVTVATWATASFERRILNVTVLLWWLAGAAEITLTQRFWVYLFLVVFVPMALMGGLLLADLAAANVPRTVALSVTAIVVALVLLGPANEELTAAAHRLSSFHGFSAEVARQNRELEPSRQLQRSIVRLFTAPDDFVYVWQTHQPWLYTDIGLTPATRYTDSRWLTGFFYARRGDPDAPPFRDPVNVLPGTEARWQEDIARTPPAAIAVFETDAAGPPTADVADLIESQVGVYNRDGYQVHVTEGRETFLDGSIADDPAAESHQVPDDGSDLVIPLPESACYVLQMRVRPADEMLVPIVTIDDLDDRVSRPGFAIATDRVASGWMDDPDFMVATEHQVTSDASGTVVTAHVRNKTLGLAVDGELVTAISASHAPSELIVPSPAAPSVEDVRGIEIEHAACAPD